MAGLASLALGTAPNGRSLADVPGQTDVPMGAPMPGAPAPAAAAAAAPVAPHLTDYAAQYEQSLAASRANVDHQIASALADISAKEAGARQAVGLLPGQVDQVYNAGNASLGQTAASLDAAQKASGLQSYMGAGAQLAPIHSAIAADLAARHADVPLLNIGLAQAAAAEHAQLAQARLAAYAGVDQNQQQFLSQQMAAQQQAAAVQAAHVFANSEQTHAADLSLRNAIATSPQANQASYGLLVTPAAGAQMATADPAHASSLRSSPAYSNVVMTLKQLGGAKVNAMLKDPAWLNGFMSGNPQYGGTGTTLSPQAISLALYDAGYKP